MKIKYNKQGNFDVPTQLAITEELKVCLNKAEKKKNNGVFLCNQFDSITFFENIKKFPLLSRTINKYCKGSYAINYEEFPGHTHWSIRMKVLEEVEAKIKNKNETRIQ